MSSWKRASQQGRRKHLERSQHSNRLHLGLLEKHKDYKLRADNRNEKKDIINGLKLAALSRNPDEFRYNMINSKFQYKRHQHKQIKHDKNSLQSLQILDKRHVDYFLNIERKRLRKLYLQLGKNPDGEEGKPLHFVFADSSDDEREILNKSLDNEDLPSEKTKERIKIEKQIERSTIRLAKLSAFSNRLTVSYGDQLEKEERSKFEKEYDLELDDNVVIND